MRDDDLLSQLEQLDPTRFEEPPAPGSSRSTSILQRAMSITTQPAPDLDLDPAPPSRRRRWPRLAVAAVAAAVAAVALLLPQPGNGDSASAAMRSAARTMAGVTNLRGRMHVETNGDISDAAMELAGTDIKAVMDTRFKEKGVHTRYEAVVVDGTVYQRFWYNGLTGKFMAEPVESQVKFVPFGKASADVLEAALQGSGVEEVGSDVLRGVTTTHYRIKLDDAGASALVKLPHSELSGFGLPDDGDLDGGDLTLDVWVDGDHLIRRLNAVYPGTKVSIEYFDFDADITITPPTTG
jgi:hypothetical protein